MTPTELQTLKAALLASTNTTVVAAIAAGDHILLAEWCNTPSTTLAWNPAVPATALFEETVITKFDNLSAGKRDAWRLLLDFAPVDFSRIKARKAVQDIWGDTDSIAVLQSVRRNVTNGELLMGSSDVTTNTVTAKKLNWSGSISYQDIGLALSS